MPGFRGSARHPYAQRSKIYEKDIRVPANFLNGSARDASFDVDQIGAAAVREPAFALTGFGAVTFAASRLRDEGLAAPKLRRRVEARPGIEPGWKTLHGFCVATPPPGRADRMARLEQYNVKGVT